MYTNKEIEIILQQVAYRQRDHYPLKFFKIVFYTYIHA